MEVVPDPGFLKFFGAFGLSLLIMSAGVAWLIKRVSVVEQRNIQLTELLLQCGDKRISENMANAIALERNTTTLTALTEAVRAMRNTG